MRALFLLLCIVSIVSSAEVDVKLYENTNKAAYYDEIQKIIESSAASELRTKETIRNEKLQLARVRDAASQAAVIERFDLSTLSRRTVRLEDFYTAVTALATLRLKQEQQRQILGDIQTKLAFLKQTIERTTEEERPQLLTNQLQFAYYKLQQKNIDAKIPLLQAQEKEMLQALARSLPAIQCDSLKNVEQKLSRLDSDIAKAKQQKVAYQIDIEKSFIQENGKRELFEKRLQLVTTLYEKAVGEKIKALSQQALCLLKEEQTRNFFKQVDRLTTLNGESASEERPLYEQQILLLRELSKEVFGITGVFFGATWHETVAVVKGFKEYISSPLFVFNEQAVSLLSLIKALILIVLGLLAGVFYKRWIGHLVRRWPDMSQMSIRLASNIGYYLIIVISFILAVSSIGIDLSSISLIAGALSIGIGFGLQTVVSNFTAGIILMFERTIRIGDFIEINEILRGKVTDIRIRSTTIQTFDNIEIVVPNSFFIQNHVINWTLDDPMRRLHIPFSVAYGTEVADVKNCILDALMESDLNFIRDDAQKRPDVWMKSMNASGVDFELLTWVVWESRLRPNALKSDFLILIYNTLREKGIQIPFPQLDLHVKEMPT